MHLAAAPVLLPDRPLVAVRQVRPHLVASSLLGHHFQSHQAALASRPPHIPLELVAIPVNVTSSVCSPAVTV